MDKIRGFFSGVSDFPYLWAAALATWGGIVAYLQRVIEQDIPFSFLRLIAEMLTSGFVGVLVYIACAGLNMGDMPTAVLVGISGHMGTRALVLLEQYYTRILRAKLPE